MIITIIDTEPFPSSSPACVTSKLYQRRLHLRRGPQPPLRKPFQWRWRIFRHERCSSRSSAPELRQHWRKRSSIQPEGVTNSTISHRCTAASPGDGGWNVWMSHTTDLVHVSEICPLRVSLLKPGRLLLRRHTAYEVRAKLSPDGMSGHVTRARLRAVSSDCSGLANLQQQ